MHRHHHGSKVVGIEHGRSCFFFLDPFVAAEQFESMAEVVQIFTFRRIDNANSFQRHIEPLCGCLDGRSVAEQDRGAQSERIKLARSLEDARLRPFRKDDPFRMPLKLLDRTATNSASWSTASSAKIPSKISSIAPPCPSKKTKPSSKTQNSGTSSNPPNRSLEKFYRRQERKLRGL